MISDNNVEILCIFSDFPVLFFILVDLLFPVQPLVLFDVDGDKVMEHDD